MPRPFERPEFMELLSEELLLELAYILSYFVCLETFL